MFLKVRNFHRKTPVLEFLIKLEALRPAVYILLCFSYGWELSYKKNKRFFFSFIFILSIKRIEISLKCCTFPCFSKSFAHFLVKKFCIRQYHLMYLFIHKAFFARVFLNFLNFARVFILELCFYVQR